MHALDECVCYCTKQAVRLYALRVCNCMTTHFLTLCEYMIAYIYNSCRTSTFVLAQMCIRRIASHESMLHACMHVRQVMNSPGCRLNDCLHHTAAGVFVPADQAVWNATAHLGDHTSTFYIVS